MTKQEMTEIFAVMILAWPNAEMFRGGVEKLAPTIELWTSCSREIDFWTAQRAVEKLCKKNKFPPTIAEFREAAERVASDIQAEIDNAMQNIRIGEFLYGSVKAYYETLTPLSRIRRVLIAMGGPDKIINTRKFLNGETEEVWNVEAFTKTYNRLLRQTKPLPNRKLSNTTGKGESWI